jgi:hypothetical protein
VLRSLGRQAGQLVTSRVLVADAIFYHQKPFHCHRVAVATSLLGTTVPRKIFFEDPISYSTTDDSPARLLPFLRRSLRDSATEGLGVWLAPFDRSFTFNYMPLGASQDRSIKKKR